jgi:hypothetical protein
MNTQLSAPSPRHSLFFNPNAPKPRLIRHLHLFIPDMESEKTKARVEELLGALPGVMEVCLKNSCASLHYRTQSDSSLQTILETLRQAGFHPLLFEDSGTLKV